MSFICCPCTVIRMITGWVVCWRDGVFRVTPIRFGLIALFFMNSFAPQYFHVCMAMEASLSAILSDAIYLSHEDRILPLWSKINLRNRVLVIDRNNETRLAVYRVLSALKIICSASLSCSECFCVACSVHNLHIYLYAFYSLVFSFLLCFGLGSASGWLHWDGHGMGTSKTLH
ncbi:hypothetical protein BDW62DRAFT_30327 [Aspergillus aurantiobrunneus]